MAYKIIVMGVSGCGKSTVAQAVAKKLGYQYIEGDEYHPQENIDKMREGIPLTDEDRQGWLETLNNLLINEPAGATLASSALKPQYRTSLTNGVDDALFVYLKGDFDTIWERHKKRKNHFFNGKEMLKSQFDTLVEPTGDNVITVDVRLSVKKIVEAVCSKLNIE